MDAKKKKRLEAAGWRVGSAAEFLGLTPEEEALVETKARLAALVREQRERAQLTQTELAKRIGSSQSRVAKIEAGDPSVSADLLLRAVFASGGSTSSVARAIGALASDRSRSAKR